MSEIINKNMEVKMEITTISIGTLAGYKPQQLHDLLAESLKELERAKTTKQWLESAIALKYGEHLRAKRLRLERDSGIVHLEDDGYRLTSEIKKKVDWDQRALAKVAGQIALNGKSLSDYMQVHYEVSENSYKDWSANIKAIFAPARIIRLSGPTYKLIKLGQEVEL